jgi:hypothetical protein
MSVDSHRVLCTHSVPILLPRLVAKSQLYLRFMGQATPCFRHTLAQKTHFMFRRCLHSPSYIRPVHSANCWVFHYRFRQVNRRKPLCFVSYHLSIIGGTSVDQDAAGGGTNQQPNRNIPAAKRQRVVGQGLMLIVNIFLLYSVVETIRQSHHENPCKRTHPILLLLLATCPLLLVRGCTA